MFVQRALRFSKRRYCGTENNRKRKKKKRGGERKHEKKKARVIFLTSVNRCCARGVYSRGAIGSRCKGGGGGGGGAGEGDAASCLLGVSVCIDKVSAP